jgi:hypothetical protein
MKEVQEVPGTETVPGTRETATRHPKGAWWPSDHLNE